MDSNFLKTNYVKIRVGGPCREGKESLTGREAYALKILEQENGEVHKSMLIRKYKFHPKLANAVLNRLEERKLVQWNRRSYRNGRYVYELTDYGELLADKLHDLHAVGNKCSFEPLPLGIIKNHEKGVIVGGGECEIKFLKDNSFTPQTQLRVLASFEIGSCIPYVRSTKGVPFLMFE